jgi:hypothetical protein
MYNSDIKSIRGQEFESLGRRYLFASCLHGHAKWPMVGRKSVGGRFPGIGGSLSFSIYRHRCKYERVFQGMQIMNSIGFE